jgi:hypothetical protein
MIKIYKIIIALEEKSLINNAIIDLHLPIILNKKIFINQINPLILNNNTIKCTNNIINKCKIVKYNNRI